MKIKVDVKLNPQAVKKLEEAMVKALPLTLEAMKTEVNNMQVVPKDIGTLEESVVTGGENGVGFMSYNTPYARRLYYHPEYNFRQDKNPNAQGRWMDSFIHGDKKKWLEETYGKFLKDNAGGVIK
ncbi:hypothetical protein GOQ29_05020 [Clostridium sp. D2Q-14]|uniref:hypothetical protein n=1 Tax=Anaeromonas gelatinilytica TaxID=2683194 RepID=UPI00193AE571|nr:hypothetical protein [Anaeromonas gelatinilytica]MBS4534978.1 hypothetical protein [Anaeromonas gelatinilytica]